MTREKQFTSDLQKIANDNFFSCVFYNVCGEHFIMKGDIEEIRAVFRAYERVHHTPTRIIKFDYPTEDWHGQGHA